MVTPARPTLVKRDVPVPQLGLHRRLDLTRPLAVPCTRASLACRGRCACAPTRATAKVTALALHPLVLVSNLKPADLRQPRGR